MTNNPICASQPMPSTNERVARRCGNSVLPSTSAARYTAAKPLAWNVGGRAVRQHREGDDHEGVQT